MKELMWMCNIDYMTIVVCSYIQLFAMLHSVYSNSNCGTT